MSVTNLRPQSRENKTSSLQTIKQPQQIIAEVTERGLLCLPNMPMNLEFCAELGIHSPHFSNPAGLPIYEKSALGPLYSLSKFQNFKLMTKDMVLFSISQDCDFLYCDTEDVYCMLSQESRSFLSSLTHGYKLKIRESGFRKVFPSLKKSEFIDAMSFSGSWTSTIDQKGNLILARAQAPVGIGLSDKHIIDDILVSTINVLEQARISSETELGWEISGPFQETAPTAVLKEIRHAMVSTKFALECKAGSMVIIDNKRFDYKWQSKHKPALSGLSLCHANLIEIAVLCHACGAV